MWCDSGSPACVHVFAPSVDTYTPLPQYELRELLASPVPTYTTSGRDWETATAPIDATGWFSNTAVKFRPLFSVLNNPPVAAAT
jgi:hypothetical protein